MQKVALVTGSGRRRIGWHVARALGERGYALAVHYHRSGAEAEQTVREFQGRGIPAEGFQADLTDERGVRELLRQVVARFGRLDVLVHCAAVWQRKRLEDITAADLRAAWEVNSLAAFLVAQQAGLTMVTQPTGGSIVLLGDWAVQRPYVDYTAYFLSKGAIATLTRCLAVELAARNPAVRVNCVMPGPVMLPADLPESERHEAIAATLLKREGRPENVAQAVIHFVENDFITGVCLPVDGGRTIG